MFAVIITVLRFLRTVQNAFYENKLKVLLCQPVFMPG